MLLRFWGFVIPSTGVCLPRPTTIMISIGVLSMSVAYAWKPNTHVYLAEEALKDAVADGKVSICQTDYANKRVAGNCRDYTVAPEILAALRAYPRQYRVGVLGPDAYPDILTGQRVIHPDESLPKKPARPGGTNSWLGHLWSSAEAQSGPSRIAVKAFVLGYLTHAAGDMFGHTFINLYAGGEFQLGPNAVRHIVLEGYIGRRTPRILDTAGRAVDENSVSIDEGVAAFIYQTMVNATPGSVLRDHLLVGSGAETSVPLIYSNLRIGLQRDIDAYNAKIEEFDRKGQFFRRNLYRLANGGEITYKENWVRDIDRGLRAWPAFSHELARALVFSANGADFERAQNIAQDYVTNHLLSMSGAPDVLGSSLALVDRALNAILLPALIEQIRQFKRAFLDRMIRQTFGVSIDELKGYVKNPENHFDHVLSTSPNSTTLQSFNRRELNIAEDGFTNPTNPTRFDYRQVPAAYNTVVMSKLILLDTSEVNQLLRDLGSTHSLGTLNLMLGFIRSLDGDNEWHANAPYQLTLALDCKAYRKIFMWQTGERGGCV